jgi:hypothetical protein
VLYRYKKYSLDLQGGKASFYEDNLLKFKGDGYVAIKMFVSACDNQNVTDKFKTQLETREKLQWKPDVEVK